MLGLVGQHVGDGGHLRHAVALAQAALQPLHARLRQFHAQGRGGGEEVPEAAEVVLVDVGVFGQEVHDGGRHVDHGDLVLLQGLQEHLGEGRTGERGRRGMAGQGRGWAAWVIPSGAEGRAQGGAGPHGGLPDPPTQETATTPTTPRPHGGGRTGEAGSGVGHRGAVKGAGAWHSHGAGHIDAVEMRNASLDCQGFIAWEALGHRDIECEGAGPRGLWKSPPLNC